MAYELTKEEKNLKASIAKAYYMPPPLAQVDAFIENSNQPREEVVKLAFDYIHDFMRQSEVDVSKLLKKRKKDGIINDIPQAGKSLVGSMFPNLLIYIFLLNKELENIASEIFITKSKSLVEKKFGDDFIINIAGEEQKADCDIIIYNEGKHKLMILSLKTSLRERAGQTYKWKLLLEIANSENSDLRNKFGISYKGENMPLVCFATVNFYEEIGSPQHRGMFKFFDKSFIARPGKSTDLVFQLSEIVNFVNKEMQ